MAIYKRYNTRKKNIRWGVIVWILCILAVFAGAAVLGHYLGEKAKGGEDLLPVVSGNVGDTETIAPLAERILHGEYVAPPALATFTASDPFTYASTWFYKDGAACFATETDKKLGKDVASLPPLSAFAIEAGTTALFAVHSVYADAQIREIITAYEMSLLAELQSAQPSEIVLVFQTLDTECSDRIFDFARSISGNTVLCVPYSILQSADCARFFSEAADAGLSLALRATDLTAEQLAKDIEDYAFYFTRYELRLALDGDAEKLIDVLREKNALNYQFCSERPAQSTTEDTAQ